MRAPARTDREYEAITDFFTYISSLEVATAWHVDSGYLPIRTGVYEALDAEGFYADKPHLSIPYLQLTRTEPSPNTSGLRFGNMPAIRVMIEEEMELALQGQVTAKRALDTAVERANVVLRAFERANR
jgi:sn-glycerol 3-phosphate transport system substrate-binding protein